EEALKLLKKFKNQKFYKEEVPEILKAIGNEELIQNEKIILENLGEIFADKDNLLFFHNNSFKGQEKELVVINELLEEILLPNTDNLYSISENLKEEIGEEEVWIGLFEGDFVDRVYVNYGNTEKFGFINIRNFSSNTGISTFPMEHSLQVLDRVSFLIKDRFSNYSNTEELKKWLKQKTEGASENGIEKRLNEIDFHQKVNPEIIIPFANKY